MRHPMAPQGENMRVKIRRTLFSPAWRSAYVTAECLFGSKGYPRKRSISIHEIADVVVSDIIAEFVQAVLRVDGWFLYDLWDVWDR